jgi:flagellar hook-length control protein FliK
VQPALNLPAPPQALPQAADNLAALAGAALAGGAAPAAAAAGETPRNLSVLETRLQAPLGSPEFAPQLGAQVSMMVRDGVQHARLHMTPAEMGPISVQIQLDGNNAQIHLAAEHAATRQALEQAMPTLAGSMREAGLTLTGGGVFEQPRQPRDEAPTPPPAGAGNRGGILVDGPLVSGPLPQVLRPGRGMLDLYA